MKKQLIAFLLAAILCIFNAVPVFAADAVGGGVATNDGKSRIIWDENESGENWVRQNADDVTVDDAISWVDRKGGQIVELCAHFLKPVCVVGFILCIILIVAGAVGNKRLLVGGLVGLFICGLCYTFATSPIQILNAFSSFMRA